MPRSMDADHTLTVTTAGWMASAADEPFTEIFVDRDLGAWGAAATNRRADLLGAGFAQVVEPSTMTDASGRGALTTAVTGTWTAGRPICEAWYDAGPGNAIGRITGTWTRGPYTSHTDANWFWQAVLSTDDRAGAFNTSGNLRAAGPGTFTLTAPAARRYAILQFNYAASAGGIDGVEWNIDWSSLAVYGDHGLPLIGDPAGVAASDVIRYLIARYCPLLNTRGVRDTTYPISQLAFKTDTTPYDAFLKVNSYHQWALAVWEDRTLHFASIDLTDWDWEIRHDDVGNTIGLQGDEYTDLRNHIRVQFDNVVTGVPEVLTGDQHPELRDDSIDNPLNEHGRRRSGEPFHIPFPTTRANALELGRLRLIEDNQPKAPGSFTVDHYIRDRAGILQPAWKVRAGDRIRLTSSANLSDRPRLIHETSYTHDGAKLTISVDAPARVVDALLDRNSTALQAAGIA
ncbi:MAG: hypothetical protein Q8O56_13940 [Solirubrobacteraceae bacterium]|nr:hypothetical protein [Solirubrobacteraceae bacterium]